MAHRHKKDNALTPRLCSLLNINFSNLQNLNTTTNKTLISSLLSASSINALLKLWYNTSSPPGATAPSSSPCAASSTRARPAPPPPLPFTLLTNINNNNNNNNNNNSTDSINSINSGKKKKKAMGMLRKRGGTAPQKQSPAWPCGCSAAGVRTWSSRLRCWWLRG